MRARAATALAVGAALLLAAGCGSRAAGGGAGRPGPPTAAFDARARQLAAQWPGSAAGRAWRTGYYPVGDTTTMPAGAFRSMADKAAFLAGRFTVAAVLPSTPRTATVRWADGGTLTLPAIGPLAALRGQGAGRCPAASCGSLTLDGAAAVTLRVPTGRGIAEVPGWSFHIRGYRGAFTVAAVAPSTAPTALPPTGAVPADLLGVAALRAVSADGRTLIVVLPWTDCGRVTAYRVEAYETGGVVVLGGWERTEPPAPGQVCAASAVVHPVTVVLRHPLGSRTVLDAAAGRPLPLVPAGG